jgi:hypothetical protein
MGRLVEDEALKDFYRILKASSMNQEADSEKDPDKRDKLITRARRLKNKLQKEELQDLFELFDAEMISRVEKPALQEPGDSMQGTPQTGEFEHPVTQQRKEVDGLIKTGQSPIEAHAAVHGDPNLGEIESKAKLAGTLGRIQSDRTSNGIMHDKNGEFTSIMAADAEIEKDLDQVTRDDLRTPEKQQVPDYQQTAGMQVAEDLEIQEDIDYTEFDVAYLQQFGRA